MSEKEQRERGMFGVTAEQVLKNYDDLVATYFGNERMAIASILSDVQELVAAGDPDSRERARQYLNCVKKIIFDRGVK